MNWRACSKCGGTACTEHHICYRSEARKHENLHDPRNKIDLCYACHEWFHQKKDRRDYLIRERELWKLFPDRILKSKYE